MSAICLQYPILKHKSIAQNCSAVRRASGKCSTKAGWRPRLAGRLSWSVPILRRRSLLLQESLGSVAEHVPSASPYVAIGRVDNQTSSPQTAARRWDSSSAPGPVEDHAVGPRNYRRGSLRYDESESGPDACRNAKNSQKILVPSSLMIEVMAR